MMSKRTASPAGGRRTKGARGSVDSSATVVEGFDACTDDIILDIATCLRPSDLLSLALACKRFGSKSNGSRDRAYDGNDVNRFNGGSIAFGIPDIPNQQTQDLGRHELCNVLEISHERHEVLVEFSENEQLKSCGKEKQWFGPLRLLTLEDFKDNSRPLTVGDSTIHYYLEKRAKGAKGAISIVDMSIDVKRGGQCYYVMGPNLPQPVLSKFKLDEESSLNGGGQFSLMERAALQMTMNIVSLNNGCIRWRYGESSWMGMYRKFERELNERMYSLEVRELDTHKLALFAAAAATPLIERMNSLEAMQLNGINEMSGIDRYLERATAYSEYLKDDLEEWSCGIVEGRNLTVRQTERAQWLVSLFENGAHGGILIDEAQERRIQVIAFLAHLRMMGVSYPHIIVTSCSALECWARDIRDLFPRLQSLVVDGTLAEREHLYQTKLHPSLRRNRDFPIIITSYDVAIQDKEHLNNIGEFLYFVLDESDRIRDQFQHKIIVRMISLRSANRLFLSGSDVEHDLDELLTLMELVIPMLSGVFLPSREEIMAESAEKRDAIVSKMNDILKPLVLSRV